MTKHLILSENVSMFINGMEDLIKKANKLGLPAPTYQIGDDTLIKYVDNTYVRKTWVEVDGNAPVLNGWTFIGTIDNLDGISVVRSIPGQEIPESYRKSSPYACVHCGINRFRTNTFILRNESGEHKQVGRTCLKDFLGCVSPESIANYAMSLIDINVEQYDTDDYSDRSASSLVYSIEYIIALAIRSIKIHGYHKADSGFPTKAHIMQHITANNDDLRIPFEESDMEMASAVRTWMSTLSGSEFMDNLNAYSKVNEVGYRSFGYIAAAAMMYLKNLKTEKIAVSYNDAPISSDGDMIRVNAKVLTATEYARRQYHYNDSGMSQVLILETADAKLIKIFTSNTDIEVGDSVIVNGRIKSHDVETFQKSSFYGKRITLMAPRTKLIMQ